MAWEVACFCGAVFQVLFGKTVCPKCGRKVPDGQT